MTKGAGVAAALDFDPDAGNVITLVEQFASSAELRQLPEPMLEPTFGE